MNRRLARVVLAFVITAGVGLATQACTDQPASTSASQAGSAQTGQVSPAAFAEAVKQPGTLVVDVRTPAEFRTGHLAAATNIDVEASDFATRVAALDKTAHYAVYCRTGNRSAVAAARMRAAGVTHVTDLAGGINAWIADGRPTVTD